MGFDDIWVPRIGSVAAAELRRNGYFTLAVGPLGLALAVGSSFAFGAGTAMGVALGVVCVLVIVGIFSPWLRGRMRVAAALSQWFGVHIGWQEMPSMRPSQFDPWCRRRELEPTQQTH